MASVRDYSDLMNASDGGSPKRSDKSGSAYGMCNREVLYHGFLCFAAIVVIVTQGTVLNFYIIAFYREYYHQVATYFLFLGDLFIVCIFAISFTTAYRYIHLRHKLEHTKNYTERQIQQKLQRSIYKHVMCLSPSRCGTLPFSFISWFAYSCYLVAKISIILSSDIPAFISDDTKGLQSGYDPIAGLGSNLLKVTTGLAALVFIIMLQAHHNYNTDSPHSGYITGVCHNIAVEVFDSVTLFSILVVQDKNIAQIRNLNNLIIVLSSINLILPTLTLYSMSMSDFGRHLEKVIGIKVVYQLLHLCVINIPFLGVRIYLWAAFNYELSLFVVKNLCYIFMLSHSLYPGISWLIQQHRKPKTKEGSMILSESTIATTNTIEERNDKGDGVLRTNRAEVVPGSQQRVQGIPRRTGSRALRQTSSSASPSDVAIEMTPMNRNPNRVLNTPTNSSLNSTHQTTP